MGVVYRAWDVRLEREVALKVLPEGALADAVSRQQFRREALTLSRLNHPNITAVYDFDEQDGLLFIAMEFVEGTTLSDRIASGRLPERAVRDLGAQLAEGLAAAHECNILHRDIKPSNLRVTREGKLKILDFGLARATRSAAERSRTETMAGVVGTIPYMAPEQVRAEKLTEATDIYAAGAVLYEMATGFRAFPQINVADAFSAILNKTPDRPRSRVPDVPDDLDRTILACLSKKPSDRPARAAELAIALLKPDSGRGAPRKKLKVPRVPRPAWIGVAMILAVSALFFLFPKTTPSLAVLPFANLTADSTKEYFADGMTDELITRLAQAPGLRVISRSSSMRYKGSHRPLAAIARELGVERILEGTIRQDGDRVRVNAQLIDPPSGRQVWSGSFERGMSDILVLQSDIAEAIVDKTRIRLLPTERSRLTSAPAVNPQAHEAFLKAETQTHLGTADKARDLYREALVDDPGYAAAYAGLAYSYTMLSSSYYPAREVMPKAEAAARMAVSLDSTSARGYGVLAYVMAFYDWNWSGAETAFHRALALSPGSAELHQNYAYFLLVKGRFKESIAEFQRARDLDPLSGWIAFMSIWPAYNSRQYDEAIRTAKTLVESDKSQAVAYHIIGQASVMKGDFATALKAYNEPELAKLPYPLLDCWRAYAYGKAGQHQHAEEILQSLLRRQKTEYVPAYGLAIAFVGLGHKDDAFQWLDRGFEDRSEDMVYLKIEPAWDPLRSDARFEEILHRMNLN